MASNTEKELSRRIFNTALALIQWAKGDTELARAAWGDAFEEAERIDHNQSLGEPDELDRAVAEQTRRFEQAVAARQKFHIVEGDESQG
jgi:hypothetical protein